MSRVLVRSLLSDCKSNRGHSLTKDKFDWWDLEIQYFKNDLDRKRIEKIDFRIIGQNKCSALLEPPT